MSLKFCCYADRKIVGHHCGVFPCRSNLLYGHPSLDWVTCSHTLQDYAIKWHVNEDARLDLWNSRPKGGQPSCRLGVFKLHSGQCCYDTVNRLCSIDSFCGRCNTISRGFGIVVGGSQASRDQQFLTDCPAIHSQKVRRRHCPD